MMFLPLFSAPDVALTSLGTQFWRQGYASPRVGTSVEGLPLLVGGKRYSDGIGSHAPGGATYLLDQKCVSIQGSVGVSDQSSGSVEFSIWGDGKRLWKSGLCRHGEPAREFSVPLSGVRRVALLMSDGGDGMGGDHANWLDVRFTVMGNAPRPVSYMKPLSPLLDQPRQTIDNFAASDSWTIEPLYRWPEAKRKRIAELLFDQHKGAGLSGWRFNLGGGINNQTINVPHRTADTFDAGEGKFDFTRVPGQRWMLDAARAYGVPKMIAYAITGTSRMTRNGFTNGTDGDGSTNLKPGQEGAFARYLAGVVEHYQKLGYPFTAISPINEPDFEWNGVPNPGSQEGSRASNADIVVQTRALAEELARRKMNVRVLTPEASSPQAGYNATDSMTKKYGSKYGAYATMFAEETEWRKSVNPIYGYHSYWSDSLNDMVSIRKRLRQELDRSGSLEVWQTEYCQMAGPRGEGGWGRDLSMTLGLNVGRLMVLDFNIVGVSAWQWWLSVSDGDYKDGLIYVDDLDSDEGGEIFPSKSLWVVGQFSRFVRPGFQRIEIQEPFDDITSVLATAFRDPKSGRVVIVMVNTSTKTEKIDLNLPGTWKTAAWITSDRPGHDIAPYAVGKLGEPITLPSRSVVTLTLDPTK